MMLMYTIELPNGVSAEVREGSIAIKGKLGSVSKKVNSKLLKVEVQGNKITITESKNKKLARVSALASKALESEIKDTTNTIQTGIEKHMKVLFAHFPMSVEIKGNVIFLKNVFGEKVPRQAKIVGSTKVEVKGQDFTIKGIDRYETGQTVANIRKACYARGYDTRVFQDGVYVVTEE